MELIDAIFGSGTPNYGAMGQRSEKKRQGIINLGMQQLNAVYGGGSAPFYSVAQGQPFSKTGWSGVGKHQTYYKQNKKGEFAPYYAPKQVKQPGTATKMFEAVGTGIPGDITGSIAGGIRTGDWGGAAKNIVANALTGGAFGGISALFGSDAPTPRELVNKQLRRGQLFNAPETRTFRGYQPEFYDAREKAYTDYALPQLADQYQSARDNTIYGLSNTGLTGSTEATKAKFKLEKAMTSGKQNVANETINQSNKLREQVEQSRQQAIQQLYQTGDPTQALKTAINTSASFERPGGFAPLAQGFGDVMNQFYIQKLLQGYQNPVGGNNNPTYFAPL